MAALFHRLPASLAGTGGALSLDIRLTFHFTKLDHENLVHFERMKITCS